MKRFSTKLEEHSFTIHYRPGAVNTNADALSRAFETETVNAVRAALTLPEIVTHISADQMIKLQDGDATVNTKVREVKSGTLKGFCIENGMLYHVKTNKKSYDSEFGKRLVIPRALVSTVLTNCHDEASGAHQSERKTWLKISARYYWDHMRRDIRKWCKSCKICAAKKPPAPHKPTLHPITHPNKAFDTVGVDSIGPLPITENGNKYI